MTTEAIVYCCFFGTFLIFGFIVLFRRLFPKPADDKELSSDMNTSSTSSMPPGASLTDTQDSTGKPATGRDALELKIKTRAQTGMCLFCDEHAHKQMPTFKPQRSLLDGLYRMLNVVPLDRYKIVLDRGVEGPHVLCEKHHERVRGLFEKRIAKSAADVADFFDEQRQSLYIFERFEVIERVESDMNAAKRGKPKLQGTPNLKNVVDLKNAKKVVNDNG